MAQGKRDGAEVCAHSYSLCGKGHVTSVNISLAKKNYVATCNFKGEEICNPTMYLEGERMVLMSLKGEACREGEGHRDGEGHMEGEGCWEGEGHREGEGRREGEGYRVRGAGRSTGVGEGGSGRRNSLCEVLETRKVSRARGREEQLLPTGAPRAVSVRWWQWGRGSRLSQAV